MADRKTEKCIVGLALLFALTGLMVSGEEDPVVQLGKSSSVRGLVSRAVDSQTPVYTFRGLYYAAPPTGKLRFAPPARRKPFQGLADAREHGPLCPQDLEQTARSFAGRPAPTSRMSEDCLHLNVHTPSLEQDAALAVVVFLPSGAYASGGGGFYDGTALAAHHRVVVVTVNSRLGALGYLSTADSASPGNFGLLDQATALHWVQANVRKFGGDTTRITLAGESAGGMAANLHLLSPVSAKQFRRAIVQSGPATAPTAIVRDPRELAERLAKVVDCPVGNTRAMVDCLRQKPAERLARIRVTRRPIEFGPVIDGFLLLNNPREMQARGHLPKKEVLLGFNSDEGSKSLLDNRGAKDYFGHLTATTFANTLEELLYLVVPRDLPVKPLVRAISKIYVGEEKLTDERAQQTISDILTDSMFVAPTVSTADSLSENGLTTFLYEFEHHSSFAKLPAWAGADHGDEEVYVWGEPFLEGRGEESGKFTEEERELSRAMMLYWTNFAKYGSPNGMARPEDPHHQVPFWPAYEPDQKKYLGLDTMPRVAARIKSEKVAFWNKLFSFWKLGKQRKEEL